jgi:hypothetical protein
MTTRRIAHWWFRFVFSGRFLETFLGGRHRRMAASSAQRPEHATREADLPMPAADESVEIE